MIEHLIEIIVMLLGAAILGFLIGWLLKKNKIDELESYIISLEEKNNRIQTELKDNDRKLINCQTEKKKLESMIQSPVKSETKIKSKDKDEKEKKPKKEKSEKKKKSSKKKKPDNLTKIEGIGPKIASILKDAGIDSFKKLSNTKAEKISKILIKAGGNSYARFDPKTWPKQAKLASDDKWDELNKWQDDLKGGR